MLFIYIRKPQTLAFLPPKKLIGDETGRESEKGFSHHNNHRGVEDRKAVLKKIVELIFVSTIAIMKYITCILWYSIILG